MVEQEEGVLLRCGRVGVAVVGPCAVGLAGSILRRTALGNPRKIKSEDSGWLGRARKRAD